VRHIAVIVKVIPGQIGKPGCRHGETVKPALVEAVARGFDRYVLNAIRNQGCEITVERDRVRGRQSAGARPGRGHQTESTKARRGKADCRPDLADKMNDRSLAVGARNGNNSGWLPTIETRCQKCQSAVRVCIDQDRNVLASFRRESESVGIVGQDRDCAAGHRFEGENPPIEAHTR
jgi:hypothetical protein